MPPIAPVFITVQAPSLAGGRNGPPSCKPFLSHTALQSALECDESVLRLSRAIVSCASGGGNSVNGCVAEDFSPGTSLCGTGFSSKGYSGLPVLSSRIHIIPCLVVWTTTLSGLPSFLISTGVGGAIVS